MPLVQTQPTYPAAPALAEDDPRSLWNEIVRWSLEACISRKEGRETQVTALLQERLPALIRQWSNSCGLAPETCKENLRSLFRRIEESAESCYLNRRLVVDDVCARLVGAPSRPIAASVPAPVAEVPLPESIMAAPALAAPAVPATVVPAPIVPPAPLPRFSFPAASPAFAASAQAAGPLQLHQRVAIDDLPGMLDAVVDAEREIRSKAVFRVRRSSRAMMNLLSGRASFPAVLTA